MNVGRCHILLLMTVVIGNIDIDSASLTDSNGTAMEDVNGEMLLKLGRTLDKPIITLFGMAIRNLERLHPCYDWTQWSECATLRQGYIASRKRTRKCGRYQSEGKTTTETDISICEGICPKDNYNVTKNGFCVKLYVDTRSFDDAEKQCQKDGGHLINVDSELKYGDVKNILKGYSGYIYIDGRRKDSSSPWLLEDGSEKEFFKWASGEPDNSLCVRMHPSNHLFYDNTCSDKYAYTCEIKHRQKIY